MRGVSVVDQVYKWDESVTSDWDAVERYSGVAKGSVADSRLRCWAALCFMESGLLTRLEAYISYPLEPW